jgi:16S rRNA (uracil1498-N3)-methyltransferase
MHRFHIDRKIEAETFSITDPSTLHHMRDVLRLKAGGDVAVFDIAGTRLISSIVRLDSKEAVLTVKERAAATSSDFSLTVACAIPKKGGIDEIIDGLTQLGIHSIIPMLTERVVARPDAASASAKLQRWQRIARSAAEQSARSDVPIIQPVTEFNKVIDSTGAYDLKLIPHLEGEKKHIRQVLGNFVQGDIIIIIGPEGDFTPAEVETAVKAGFVPVSLGETTLRVATAALVAAAFIMLSKGDETHA